MCVFPKQNELNAFKVFISARGLWILCNWSAVSVVWSLAFRVSMPFQKKNIVQFNFLDLYIEYRVLFFEENLTLKVKAVQKLLTLSVCKIEAYRSTLYLPFKKRKLL